MESKVPEERLCPTVRDVARLAGVSIATVSRVINGARNVTEPTRARVKSVIQSLNFSPNASAAHLGRSRGPRFVIPTTTEVRRIIS